MMAGSKFCSACGKLKAADAYGKCRSSKDGLYGQCKICRGERNRLWSKSKNGIISLRRSRRKYWKTEKGRITQAKYNASPARKKVIERHLALPRVRYLRYKTGAKHRGIKFNLTFNEFMGYWQKPCFYCDEKIETVGLDRVDNSQGYILSNIVSCCYWCNIAKSEQSIEQYVQRCCRVANKKGGTHGS